MLIRIFKTGIPLILVIVAAWLFFSPTAQVGYAPNQPIAYSHKLHAGNLDIDCQYCHVGVTKSRKAAVPSINICMNCHTTLGTGKPEVEKLRTAFTEKKSPEWIRVHNLPDHVQFSHASHVRFLLKQGDSTKTACMPCHGDVSKMEIVAQVETLNMGFCVNCHRGNTNLGAKINCSTCHY